MPRPFRTPAAIWWLAAATTCAALGPAALAVALAAAAGTLFEAAPFVLVAEALPAGRLRTLGGFAGCGCGDGVPGALSLGAVALCWFAFGPLVTLARMAAGVALLALRARRMERSDPLDAFTELLRLAPCAAAAGLASAWLARHAPAFAASGAGKFAEFAAGTVLGCIAPCGTAAVAIAAALAPHGPFATAGVLITGGLAPRAFVRRVAHARAAPRLAGRRADLQPVLARAALAAALGVFAVTHAPGFVNPRLLPFVWIGTLAAAASLRRPIATRAALLVPAAMFAALACGSPPPPFVAEATRLEDAFPGERLAFTGVARRVGAATVIERFAITCCRADATPVSVVTASALRVSDGAWVRAEGVLQSTPAGLVLRPASWHQVGVPADPFLYR